MCHFRIKQQLSNSVSNEHTQHPIITKNIEPNQHHVDTNQTGDWGEPALPLIFLHRRLPLCHWWLPFFQVVVFIRTTFGVRIAENQMTLKKHGVEVNSLTVAIKRK